MNTRRALPLTSLLLALALPRAARADQADAFRSAGHAWFDGERSSGYLWGAAGVASLGAAGALYFQQKSDLARGISYPLAAFGVLQAAIGVGSLARGSARADALDAAIARSPEDARQSEIARMRRVNYAFLAIEIVETALIVGGASFAATRRHEGQELARGVGLGLAMEGGLMLLLDALAASRAHTYAGQLDAFSFGASTTSSARWLSFQGTFR